MEKVFITGRGLVTPLGNSLAENEAALRAGKSGIGTVPSFVEHEMTSTVGGITQYGDVDPTLLDRKTMRFCPPTGVMSILAVDQVFREAGIPRDEVKNHRIAIVSGIPDSNSIEIFETAYNYTIGNNNMRAVSPCAIPRIMASSAGSIISMTFGITGESFDISAACSSSAIAVMLGARLIRSGEYDMVLVGGAEALDWCMTVGFCACHALSRKYNDTPHLASRPFDRDRDGFVISSGAAFMLLESEKSVQRRNVRPISCISGYAANSNATDMVVPDAERTAQVMRAAISAAGLTPDDIGYVNTHGTSTPVGDKVEMEALHEVFGSRSPAINSTKSQTGHMIGATGAAEVIFSSLMLEKDFLSPSVNLFEPDPEFAWADLVRECRTGTKIRHALSNSFAFGGSNCALVISDLK